MPFYAAIHCIIQRSVPVSERRSSSQMHIAVVSLIPNLGDAIMMLPQLQALKASNPSARITCVCNSKVAGFIEGLGLVDTVVPIRMRQIWGARWSWWRQVTRLAQLLTVPKRMVQQLSPDVCVLLRAGVDPFMSAVLAVWSGASRRVGISENAEPEKSQYAWGADRLLTDVYAGAQQTTEVERGLAMLAWAGLVGAPELGVVDSVISPLIAMAEREILPADWPVSQDYGVIAPCGSAKYRQWPVERFAEIGRKWRSEGRYVVVIGAKSETCKTNRLVSLIGEGAVSMAGRTSLPELVGLLLGARIFLGNDSGPAHIASAIGTPTVVISAFAATGESRHHNSPWRSRPVGPYLRIVQPEIPQSPCVVECIASRPHCIRHISVAEVEVAVSRLFRKKALS